MTPHSWTSLGNYRYISGISTRVPTAFTSTNSYGFRGSNFDGKEADGTTTVSNAITPLYQLTCGYRTILNTKNYINPVNGGISTTLPSISGKAFTSKCNNDTTTLVSGYSSYLASGIFMDDSGWELITGNEGSWPETYSDNALNEENLGSTGYYLYYHTSLIVATNGAFNYGYIVVKTLWEGKDTSYPKPSWDYTNNESAEWICGGLYSLTSPNP